MKKVEEIKKDIMSTDMFTYSELEPNFYNDVSFYVFKSWEYYQIFYLTNSDLYYIDEETEKSLNLADNIQDTPKGRIYCFN